MDLQAKAIHNYLPYLVKTDENTPFHSTIDIILKSKYLTILTADAPIYLDTLQEFWLNAEFLLQDKKPTSIISKIGETSIVITPELISTTFSLNDLSGKDSFPKAELHTEFQERGYDAQMTGSTLFKKFFPPVMKFFFHTLLLCVSAKSTSFNEIPLRIQYLGYAMLSDSDFNLSQGLFMDLVSNVKAIKSGSNNAFLIYPRILSVTFKRFYLKKISKRVSLFK
jgi:hypothetical protein